MASGIEGVEICGDGEPGAVVVLIGEVAPVGAFDEWLASIHGDGRVELTKPAAELRRPRPAPRPASASRTAPKTAADPSSGQISILHTNAPAGARPANGLRTGRGDVPRAVQDRPVRRRLAGPGPGVGCGEGERDEGVAACGDLDDDRGVVGVDERRLGGVDGGGPFDTSRHAHAAPPSPAASP